MRQVWSVAGLLHAIGDALAARFAAVTVQGELSSFSRAPSGHCYFALKDDQAREPALIRGAMFRRAASLLNFEPREGQLVEIRGRLAVYDARGDLQLVAEAMRPAGQGALYEQFLRLKARLEADGLFDPARKRSIPAYPRSVGIVSSKNAAALHDVLTCLSRRAPHVRVIVYPASVQGAQAPEEIVRAIESAVARAEVDTLIVCRGGGSLEDLWSFNDERVARAIAGCPIPVISGVGHETDFTIADFVADQRAPTPTAAGELAAPQRDDCLAHLQTSLGRIQRAMLRRADGNAQRLDHAALRLARPAQVLSRMHRWIELLAQRLAGVPRQYLQVAQRAQAHLAERHVRAARVRRQTALDRLDSLSGRLEALNPQRVLQRGFAYVTDAEGHALVSVRDVGVGDEVQAVLADGRLRTRVSGIDP